MSAAAGSPVPAGLRLRIWLACMAGSVIAALGLVWVGSTVAPYDGQLDPVLLAVFPWALAGLGVLVGIAAAMWLDHNIVGHLRGLTRALADERVAALRGLPAVAEWGELSELTQGVQRLITRVDRLHAEGDDARHARAQLEATLQQIMDSLELWARDVAEPFPSAEGPVAAIGEVLRRRSERETERREQGRETVREIRAGVMRGLEEARETESQAERGFVEATALLTTVRELQRLRAELEGALARAGESAAATPALEAFEAYRAAAASAIEELVSASTTSVERLAAGLVGVQEISDQVHTLANRATLVALDAAIGAVASRPGTGPAGFASPAERAAELRRLAADVQTVTTRTTALARDVDREVAAAIDRMRGLRQQLGDRLEPAAPAVPAGDARDLERAARLLERVRDMIQDAMEKGERLSFTGERASSAAQRLVHRLEEELPTLEDLIARLASDASGSTGAAVPDGVRRLTAADLEPETGARAPDLEAWW